MKNINNKILEILQALFQFVFSINTLITVLFLLGLTVILYTVFSISLVAFGFLLGFVLIAIALLLHQAQR